MSSSYCRILVQFKQRNRLHKSNRITYSSIMLMGEEAEGNNNNNNKTESDSVSSSGTPKHHATSSLQTIDPAAKTDTGDFDNRDTLLAKIEAEKILALIKAWEETEKTKVENRAYKRHTAVGLWEDSKKASVEAKLKRIEEKLERKKAEYVEKMQNKIAEIHLLAEGRRARVEAEKGQELLKAEETATKFRTHGYSPRKFLSCLCG